MDSLTFVKEQLTKDPTLSNGSLIASGAGVDGVKVYQTLILKAKRELGIAIATRGRKPKAAATAKAKVPVATPKTKAVPVAEKVEHAPTVQQVVEVMSLAQKIGGLAVIRDCLDVLKKAGVA